jgi:hypothetical protein
MMRRRVHAAITRQHTADLGFITLLLLLPLITNILALHSFLVWVPLPVVSP